MAEYRYGSLYVIETGREKNDVQAELRTLDDRLFLERQVDLEGKPVWCVVCQVGGDVPPVTIMEWRDDRGNPIPELSSGLVARVARMERDGARLAASVIKRNRDKAERELAQRMDAYRGITEDTMKYMSDTRSGLLPRGQGLRRARDKQRAMGRKV